MTLPRQEHPCDKCKTYDPVNGTTRALCAIKGHCPGLENEAHKRYKIYKKKLANYFSNAIGHTRTSVGRMRGRVVDTVIKDVFYTGRYLFTYDNKMYFLTLNGEKIENFTFENITYLEAV